MRKQEPVDQQIVDCLKEQGTGTVDDIAAAEKISLTSARKYLAGLSLDGKVSRDSGGREGRRKLPDVFGLFKNESPGKSKKAASGTAHC